MSPVRFAFAVFLVKYANSEPNCTDLKDLTTYGTYALQAACALWPTSKWGEFPTETVQDAEALLNATFGPDGVYHKVKQMSASRLNSSDFCWKAHNIRPLQTPTGYSCPELFMPANPYEKKVKTKPDADNKCTKSCSDVCDIDYGGLPVEPQAGGECGCADPVQGYSTYIWHNFVPAYPEGCALVHDGKCFNKCADQFEVQFLIGDLSPTCASRCFGTEQKFECGFGCAKSSDVCMSTVVSQVGEVVKSVTSVAGFMTGHPELALTAEALISAVEFAITVVGKAVVHVLADWKDVDKSLPKAQLYATLLQLIIDEAAKDKAELQKLLTDMSVPFHELIEGFSRAHVHGFIAVAKTFLKHGAAITIQIYNVLKSFLWPICKVVPTSSLITV